MHRNAITATVLAGALTLVAVGCGSDDVRDAAEPLPTTSIPDGLPLDDASGSDTAEVLVEGYLITQGDDVLLASVLAESYPPQAAGVVLTVVGLDLDTVEGLTTAQGVNWTEHPVQFGGIVEGDVLTITTGSPTGDGTAVQEWFLDIDDNGASLSIAAGDLVTLELEGNPTTGYTWEITIVDGTALTVLGEPEYRSDTALVGSPGVFSFRFRAAAEGETEIELVYHRSWENEDPLQTFRFAVNVG
jgi:predicted secreted protein